MTMDVLGLDIGGANLKAAHTDGSACTVAFPLWKHPERLHAELERLCAIMPGFRQLAVTMTGELCDCFPTKREGVRSILESVMAAFPAVPARVWSTAGRFVDFEDALANPLSVAAANWLALAHFVGRRFADANVLLIDTGSTTTDIVYIRRGVPAPRALTDPGRLASGELVYTGVRRTPICAVLGMEVAAEFFATMLDAYLILGMLPANPSDCDTADGRPATVACAHARLARMRCADTVSFDVNQACALAERAVAVQRAAVHRAVERVVADEPTVERVVVSGSGEILGRGVAAIGWPGVAISSLAETLGPTLSEAACAYAVAMVAQGEVEVP